MNSLSRVLVTGIGGDVGQATVKALKMSKLHVLIDGADCTNQGAAIGFVEQFHMLPRASECDNYVDSLCNLVRIQRYDAVIPTTEPEIAVLSNQFSRLEGLVPLLMQDPKWISIYGDKLVCLQTLSQNLAMPMFADPSDDKAMERLCNQGHFPLVVKKRRGAGSKNVAYAQSKDEALYLSNELSPAVVMEYLSDDKGEFSVGVYRDEQSCCVLTMLRELGPGGCSWRGRVVDDQDVAIYAESIARASGLRGVANIQVRKSSRGVFLLEINPRISSLAAARAATGFNDVEWWLCDLLKRPKVVPSTFSKLSFERYLTEVIDFGAGWEAPAEWSPYFPRRR